MNPRSKGTYLEYRKIISEIISQGIRQGLFKKNLDPDVAALTFMALHDGVLHQWVLNRYHLDGELYVRTFREVFLHGLVREELSIERTVEQMQSNSSKGSENVTIGGI